MSRLITLIIAVFWFGLPLNAQSQFKEIIIVNQSGITQYELDQRTEFLRLLRVPGDPAQVARKQLTEDRLKHQAARQNGITVSNAEIQDGMEEFASRANMSASEFISALNANGVSRETFRDFVSAGLAWRNLVQQRFGGQARVTDSDIDKALGKSGATSTIEILASEIIMPMPPRQAATVMARAEKISKLTTASAFSAQARKYSATATRRKGGKLDWTPLSDMPPALRPLLLALSPGEVTDPIQIPNAVALFQLRGLREVKNPAPEITAIEYAAYYIDGGRSTEALKRAKQIRNRVDTCDDLYGIAKGQPESVLDRGAKAPSDIPTDIALELAKLDDNEVSTALTRANGQTLVFLMLCGRTTAIDEDVSREEIGLGLRNSRLEKLANNYLAQLKSDARIVEK